MELNFIELIQTYGSQGIFFILFIYLFKRQEKLSDKREEETKEEKKLLFDELKTSQELNKEAQDLLKTFANKYDLIDRKIDRIESAVLGNKGGVL